MKVSREPQAHKSHRRPAEIIQVSRLKLVTNRHDMFATNASSKKLTDIDLETKKVDPKREENILTKSAAIFERVVPRKHAPIVKGSRDCG